MKLSRNGPCSCGSGKKYKQCCLQLAVAQTSTSPFTKPHDGAISKSLHWLKTHQRKGWHVAFDNLMQELLIEEDRETLSQLDSEITEGIDINHLGHAHGRYILLQPARHQSPRQLLRQVG